METVYPTGDGFCGFFATGFRKGPSGATQRVGTVILKRTYDIGVGTGSDLRLLTPAAEALSVFEQDQPDMSEQVGNLIPNGDFKKEDIAAWQPASGATVARVEEPDSSGEYMLRVTGSANRRVTHTLSLPEPLAGHKFTLVFAAKADAPTDVAVELSSGAHVICEVDAELETDLNWYGETGRWPDSASATDLQVVLRTAAEDGRTVFYDNVTLFSMVRFEHDLAPFKPEGDAVALGYTGVTEEAVLRVGEQPWLERDVSSGDFELFGWEPRAGTSREAEAGTFSPDAGDYPPEWPLTADNLDRDPLPSAFQNTFFNGYLRDAHVAPAETFLQAADEIEIERDGDVDYAFQLHGEEVSAAYLYYPGSGADEELCWRSVPVAMNLDTLVVEPEIDRCYAVWRGAWDFDEHASDVYRRLVVSVTEP